jgi:hypothetical protein
MIINYDKGTPKKNTAFPKPPPPPINTNTTPHQTNLGF